MADYFEKQWEREQKLRRHNTNRGSKFPPFSIEPLPNERHRLAGQGMTAQDRVLRKQWLQDQVLSPNEPRVVPELNKRNPIRRAASAPWNALFDLVGPLIGPKAKLYARYYVPRFTVAFGAMWFTCYWFKYNLNDWTRGTGWHKYTSRPRVYPGDKDWPNAPQKGYDDFFDKGFKNRDVFLDLKVASPRNA